MLGHLQRGGAPTTFDRVLATQYGAHAVRLIVEGRLGEMICYHPPEMDSVPIMQAVNRIRTVDADGAAVQAARALGICFGDASGRRARSWPASASSRLPTTSNSTPSSRSTWPKRPRKKRWRSSLARDVCPTRSVDARLFR